jgi:hypothetical protein
MEVTSMFRISSNAVSAVLGAAAFGVLTAGTAAAVTTSAVSITNPSTGVRAHVTGKESLVTSARDPYSGVYAKVDAYGNQLVGHGAPATVWAKSLNGALSQYLYDAQLTLTAPSSGRLAIRSISLRTSVPTGQKVNARMVYTERDGGIITLQIPMEFQGGFTDGDVFVANVPTELYPKAATNLNVIVVRSGAGATSGSIVLSALGQIT